MEKDARNNTAGGRSSRPMIVGGVAAIAVGSALLWASETAGGLPDAVAWGVWGAGVAMICAGSLRNRKELKVAAESAGQAASSPEGSGSPAPQVAAEPGMQTVEALVQRSDDVAATLRDLVSHGQSSADYGMLPALLVRSGLMDWEGAPRFTANRLRRNRRWWMSCDVDELTEDGYDRLIALEGALNLAADLAEGACPDAPDDQGRIEALFRDLASLSPLPTPEGRTFPAGEKDGEWAARLALSEWLENLPAPFRVVSAFQLDLDEGLACVDVAVPSPSCLALVAPGDEALQAAEARRYAWRLALTVARGAFAASPRIGRVGVNCVSHGARETLLSLLMDRGELDALLAGADAPGAGPAPGETCRVDVAEDGRMRPVRALLARSDSRLNPASRWDAVELDPMDASAAVREACGAARVSDLGINENARRVAAWNQLAGTLGATTADAVARLMATRDASEDQTVREACSRTCQALVDGAVDASDHQALALAFVLGGPLDQAQRQALDLAGEDAGPADLERALGLLDAVLVPLAQAGAYADGPTRVFRYFNSAAERVRFNRTVADGRDVVLVPDAYYAAHSLAARVLTQLGRAEEAQVHADELARVAPVTPDAALSRVRVLEAQERIFECVDVLVDAMGYAATAREMSICLYRLAYMEWRLGRNRLAVACYERSMRLHGEIASQAKEELDELLDSEPGLSRLDPEECARELSAAGIPLGDADGARRAMEEAAAACVDARLMGISRAYLAVALEVDRDDALLGVYRSLASVSPEG
ncbi:hypothetical protein [Paratractidigestivibacter faecalis]|uniref:hypothetical protein n=1 Tax=Paratractidigestivibacter faecalis TaxID=2292441 RepID=UPI00388F2AB9